MNRFDAASHLLELMVEQKCAKSDILIATSHYANKTQTGAKSRKSAMRDVFRIYILQAVKATISGYFPSVQRWARGRQELGRRFTRGQIAKYEVFDFAFFLHFFFARGQRQVCCHCDNLTNLTVKTDFELFSIVLSMYSRCVRPRV